MNTTGDVQAPGTNYTLKGDDVPSLLYRLASGTPALYADLVSANTTFKPTYSKRGESGLFDRSWWSPWGSNFGSGGTFAKVPVVGSLAVYKYQSRNPDDTGEYF